MIRVHSVTYQNFLAAGAVPITVVLDQHQSTLVVGKNGAGKSTVTDALCFGWFGRGLREVTKGLLVNSINQKECLVEVAFGANGQEYLVRRGIKPTLFEIYENGKLIPAPADIKDYQSALEVTILRLNFKAFMQVVVLGASSYVPFMRLSTGARRGIIEDLLDIEVFSSMNVLAKEDASTLKADIAGTQAKLTMLREQLRMAESFTAQLAEQTDAQLAAIDAALVSTQAAYDAVLMERRALREEMEPYGATKQALQQAQTKQREFTQFLRDLKTKAATLDKDRAFYTDHDSCPECEQDITSAFKQGKFTTFDTKATTLAQAIVECEGRISRYQAHADAASVELDAAARLSLRMQALDTQLPMHNYRLKDLQRERAALLAPKAKTPAVDVEGLRAAIQAATDIQVEQAREKVTIDAATMLLKDDGIKTRVVRHYLPIINKQINAYLNAMDFPILFQFDEQFTEHLKSRHRDEFSYASFSEGEKKRIDLALLLTWRAVARLKNSASTNLLVLDEVFDSSLDASGTEEFLKIIQDLESDTNVFVISHKTDQLVDKFANVLTFEQHRGFSQLKVA